MNYNYPIILGILVIIVAVIYYLYFLFPVNGIAGQQCFTEFDFVEYCIINGQSVNCDDYEDVCVLFKLRNNIQ